MNRPHSSRVACGVHLRRLLPFVTAGLGVALVARADFISPSVPVVFALAGPPVGGAAPAGPAAPYLTGSRIAALPDGALAIDEDSGALIRADAEGAPVGQLAIGRGAGLLAYDPVAHRAYVADRRGDRVVVVDVGAQLQVAAAWPTPAEPYGVALAPDRATLLVTAIADRTLVAYDTATGRRRWTAALGAEPRGVAIAPDGTRALVASLATGAVDEIDLLETHAVTPLALAVAAPSDPTPAFARDAFAVTFLGAHQAVVPFQRETPVRSIQGVEMQQQVSRAEASSYGGGGGDFEVDPPIHQQLAFFAQGPLGVRQVGARIGVQQPRALAWDSAHDALYVAGLGSDTILQLRHASQADVAPGFTAQLTRAGTRCGPDGLAVTPAGDLIVWCAFTRSIAHVAVPGDGTLAAQAMPAVAEGGTLVTSALDARAHAGMVLFHSAEPEISAGGALACASCHPEGRDDGMSWRIDRTTLQTPLLAGRVAGTRPYKWDGRDKTLARSLATTMQRLGGAGLSSAETAQLAAYLEAMPPPRTATRDPAAVARGEALFDSAQLGCRSCHDGPAYTDRDRHGFGSAELPQVDTPSLVGLAASAPYFHDGSAPTLEALLHDRGTVHGMAETAKLSDAQVADLMAFLETR